MSANPTKALQDYCQWKYTRSQIMNKRIVEWCIMLLASGFYGSACYPLPFWKGCRYIGSACYPFGILNGLLLHWICMLPVWNIERAVVTLDMHAT